MSNGIKLALIKQRSSAARAAQAAARLVPAPLLSSNSAAKTPTVVATPVALRKSLLSVT
jgi:hypothetical protein